LPDGPHAQKRQTLQRDKQDDEPDYGGADAADGLQILEFVQEVALESRRGSATW
jgi:hypothetical protein